MWAKAPLASVVLSMTLIAQGLAQQLLPAELSTYFQVNNALESVFNGVTLTQPGQLISAADTKTAPTINIKNDLPANSSYLFIMVDADFNSTVPTNVVVHTIVGNITIPSAAAPLHQLVTASSPAVAPYIGPQPPSGKASHNYTLLVFPQPQGFVVPAAFDQWLPLNLSNVFTRTNFPLLDFVQKGNLGNPVAANYFRLDLSSSNSSSATAGASVPSSTSTGSQASMSPISTSGAGHSGSLSGMLAAAWTVASLLALC